MLLPGCQLLCLLINKKRENAFDERGVFMSQAHFQTTLFQEIIQGIATSCEGYLLEGKEMIEAAASIYLGIEKDSKESKTEETKLCSEWTDGEVKYSRISTCERCNHKIVRFIADDVRFCPGCGRRIVE